MWVLLLVFFQTVFFFVTTGLAFWDRLTNQSITTYYFLDKRSDCCGTCDHVTSGSGTPRQRQTKYNVIPARSLSSYDSLCVTGNQWLIVRVEQLGFYASRLYINNTCRFKFLFFWEKSVSEKRKETKGHAPSVTQPTRPVALFLVIPSQPHKLPRAYDENSLEAIIPNYLRTFSRTRQTYYLSKPGWCGEEYPHWIVYWR